MAMAGERDPPDLVALIIGPVDAHGEAVRGKVLDLALPPFDDGDTVGEGRVEVEVIEIDGAAESVGIDVNEIDATSGLMDPGNDEGRARHRFTHAEPSTQTLYKSRLTCT